MRLSIAIDDEEARQMLGRLASSLESRDLARVLRRALTVHARTIRSAIRASSAPPRVKRAVSRSVGTALKRRGQTITQAKVGIQVGRGSKRAPHAHFFVLGTAERYTRRGERRGRIVPMLKGVVAATRSKFVRSLIEACKWYVDRVMRSLKKKGA